MDTIPQLLEYQAQKHARHPAMRIKRLGIWETKTWSDVYKEVSRLTGGLLELGLAQDEVLVVIGNNAPEIYCAMTAGQIAGAIAAPMYEVPPNDSYAHMMQVTGARFVVVQDQQQVDALLDLQRQGISLQKIIYVDQRGIDASYDSNLVQSYDDVCQLGDSYLAAHPDVIAKKINEGRADDVAVLMFNSGIDEVAKAAQLTYTNLLSVGNYLVEQERIDADDELLSFMPISLAPNLLCGYVMSHIAGFCVSCPESPETVMGNLHEITPSILYAPPYVYKQMVVSMNERMDSANALSKWLYKKFLKQPASQGKDSESWLAEILIRAPIRSLYGLGRLHLGFTGGDFIHVATFNTFKALGVELKQMYGTAETSGCITAQTQERSAENVGHVVDPEINKIKISDDKEILCKGNNVFRGYYRDDEATRAVLDEDGWYRTGDIGEINADGTLQVHDKLVAQDRLNSGVVYSPKMIENLIKSSPYIKEVLVHIDDVGENLFAVICIETSSVGRWAEMRDVRYTSHADLASNSEVYELIRQALDEVTPQITDLGQPLIHAFVLMQRDFLLATDELTWTNKLRRSFLKDYFSNLARAVSSKQSSVEIKDAASHETVELAIVRC